MANTWKSLVNVALLGTDRGKLSEEQKATLQQKGIPTTGTPAEIIMNGAAYYAQVRKVGLPQVVREEALPFPAAKESLPTCNTKSSQHLALILNGTYDLALNEFLNALAQIKHRLPEETLPQILEKCKKQPDLWQVVQPSIGERGHWLLEQNPKWAILLKIPQQEDWAIGSHTKRLKLLTQLRKDKSPVALTLLESTWAEEAANHKVDFLKIMEINLSKLDELFLNKLLDARQKEVRQSAAFLLARIPDSALILRMFERVKSYILIKKGSFQKEKLEITLPEDCDDSMLRDGINPRSQWFRGGLKASRLGQMITMIPPKYWEVFFDKKPKEVIQIFLRTDQHSELLMQAIIKATDLSKDEDWLDAILTFWLDSKSLQRWKDLKVMPLLEQLPAYLFNKIAANGLESINGLLEETDPITTLLKSSQHQWSDELTILFVNNLKKWLEMESSRYWNGWHYRGILKKAAYSCNPAIYNKISENWPIESRIWSSWEKEVQAFLNIIQFRKMMLSTLHQQSKII